MSDFKRTDYKSPRGNRVFVAYNRDGNFVIFEEERGRRADVRYRFPALLHKEFSTRAKAQEALDCYAGDHDLEVWE